MRESLALASRLLSSWLKPAQPSYLIYFVTARCNARCEMCFYWRELDAVRPETELTPEETDKISRTLPPLIQLTLSGGEPFLRADLFELIKPLLEHSRPALLSIPTNGILTEQIIKVTGQICSAFPRLRLNLELSLDGIGERHDRIRGHVGAFADLLRSWKELKILRLKFPNLRLNTLSVLSALNSDRIFELLEYIRTELKPNRSEVMFVRGEPRTPGAAQVSLDRFKEVHEWLKKNARPKTFLDRLREQLAMAKRELIIETVRGNKMILPCRAGGKLIVMEPDGWVRPCEMLSVKYPVPPPSLGAKDFRLGSLRESGYDLMKILGSAQAQKVNNFIRASECRCSYECAALANLVFSPGQMPRIFWKAFR